MRSHQDLHRLRRDQTGLPRGLFLRFALLIVAVSVKIKPKTYRDMRNNCTEPANKMTTPQRSERKISFRVLTTLNTRAYKAIEPHHFAIASSSYSVMDELAKKFDSQTDVGFFTFACLKLWARWLNYNC